MGWLRPSAKKKKAEDELPPDHPLRRSLGQALGEVWLQLTDWIRDLPGIRERLKNLPDSNYELALSLAERGRMNDALLRFWIVTRLRPEHAMAWYNLGCCWTARSNFTKAKRALARAHKLAPEVEEIDFMQRFIDPDSAPAERIPPQLVRRHMELYGGRYDEMLDYLGYVGAEPVAEAAREALSAAAWAQAYVVDVGCGTGRVGAAMLEKPAYLTGVDLSAEVLEVARSRMGEQGPSYDRVMELDLWQVREEGWPAALTNRKCDVIIAADVLGYLGALTPWLVLLGERLKMRGGVLVFSVAACEEGKGRVVLPNCLSMAYDRACITQAAEEAGYEVLQCESAPLYENMSGWVAVLRLHGKKRAD